MTEKKGIGKTALKTGLITREQLDECRRISKKSKGQRSVSDLLVEKGYLSLADLDRLVKEESLALSPTKTQRRRVSVKLQKTMRKDIIEEHSFAKRVLESGLATREQILACIEEQDRLADKGKKVRIGQIMMKRGILQLPQFLSLLQEHHSKSIMECSLCEKKFNVRKSPGKRYRCKTCGGLLSEPKKLTHVDVTETLFTDAPLDGLPGGGIVGNYQILEEVARGGMGVVYKARQRNVNRIVALKMIKEEDRESRERIHRFVMEARAAGKLRHPNIVSVHEFGRHFGHYYFTMDFIEGAPLDEVIHKRILSQKDALSMMIEICRAVQYANAEGIIHRDLKPANILIDSYMKPHITDFGLSKTIEGKNLMTHTQEGVDLGTPYYMSPEQVKGEVSIIDSRTDVYAIGVILYQVLTERLPFTGSSVVEVYHKILYESFRSPRKIKPEIPRDLECIIMKAMAREMSDRYNSGEELAQDLERFLRGEPVLARGTAFEEGWRRMKSRPSYLIGTGIILIMIAAFLLFLFHKWVSQRKKFNYPVKERIQNKLNAKEKALEIITNAAKNPQASDERDILMSQIAYGNAWNMNLKGDYQSALADLDNALKLDSQNEPALFLRGDIHLKLREYRKAIKDFSDLLNIKALKEYYRKRILAYFKVGEYLKATADCTHLLPKTTTDSEAAYLFTQRGLAHYKACQYNDAYQDYWRATRLDPKYPYCHYYNGNLYNYYYNDPKTAIENYDYAIQCDPSIAEFYLDRGIAYYFLEGLRKYLFSIDLEYERDLNKENEATDKYNKEISKEVREEFKKNGKVLSENASLEIQDKGAKWVIEDNRNKYWIIKEGKKLNIYLKRALEDFNNCYDHNSELITTIIEVALEAQINPQRFNFSIEKAEQFIKALRSELGPSPEEPKSLLYLGAISLYEGEYDKAIDMFEKAKLKNPYDSAHYILGGLAYLLKGSITPAKDSFSFIIKVRPRDFFANLHRGICYLKDDTIDKAINDFTNAELSERVTDLHHLLLGKVFVGKGLAYFLQGSPSYSKAAHEFERAIDVASQDPDGYIHLAMLMISKKIKDNPIWNPSKALKNARKALELNNKSAFTYYILSQIYQTMGDYQRSEQASKLSLKCRNYHPVFLQDEFSKKCP